LSLLAESIRALAGTEAQPPPDARVKELEGALRAARAALDSAILRHRYMVGGGVTHVRCDLCDPFLAVRPLLGASEPTRT
jgi:hypothetical protein